MNVQGERTCFGFAVDSTLPFRFLRGGGGDRLEVIVGPVGEPRRADLLFDWRPNGDQPHSRLYRDPDGYRYWVDGGGWFLVEPQVPRVVVPAGGDALRREERLWTIPGLLCFAARGDVPLHASAVEVGGGAVVIAGPRTFGKTTLAAGFLAAGHRVLADDITCLRPGIEPAVVPGPAMLRVRHDVADELELERAEPLRRDGDRVHLALESGSRGTSDALPLRAIVLLRGVGEAPALTRVPAARALPDLWELSFRIPGAAAFAASFAALADIAAATPVWNLFRPLRLDALDETVETVVTSI